MMKTAARIDITVPESRKLEVELPPDVPIGKAKLIVMVEEHESAPARRRLASPRLMHPEDVGDFQMEILEGTPRDA